MDVDEWKIATEELAGRDVGGVDLYWRTHFGAEDCAVQRVELLRLWRLELEIELEGFEIGFRRDDDVVVVVVVVVRSCGAFCKEFSVSLLWRWWVID